jgi:type II secretory pathway pseudopilin PulG
MSPLARASPHRLRQRQRPLTGWGFSLTEVMISAAVGAVILTSVAGMNNVSNRTILDAGQQESVEAAINSDLDMIRQKMISYTWCSGTGTIGPVTPVGTSNTCSKNLSAKGSKEYYFPNMAATPAATAIANRDAFYAACNQTNTTDNSFLAPLITSINSQTLAGTSGLTRQVAISDGSAKKLLITYSSSTVQRSVLLTPTVASWCP